MEFHTRVFAKAEFTNPIPQKIRRTKKYCGIPQNKGHEFHNIFKFCGTTPQIIPTHVFFRPVKYFVENRFRFRKSISTSDSTNKIRTFFVEFRFVNSVFANTLLTFDISASWTHEDEHYFLRFSPFECKIWKYCFAISYPREKKLVW